MSTDTRTKSAESDIDRWSHRTSPSVRDLLDQVGHELAKEYVRLLRGADRAPEPEDPK